MSEEQFLAFIRANKHLGYGRMMQIISHEWWRHDPHGALSVGDCYALIKPSSEKQASDFEARHDPLFGDGAK